MEVPLEITDRFVPKDSYYAQGFLSFKDDNIELTFFYRKNKGDLKRRVDVLLGITEIGDVLATEPVPFE